MSARRPGRRGAAGTVCPRRVLCAVQARPGRLTAAAEERAGMSSGVCVGTEWERNYVASFGGALICSIMFGGEQNRRTGYASLR